MARPAGLYARKKKLLLSKIAALSSPTEPCWASNKFFGKFLGCGERQASRYVGTLKKDGEVLVQIMKYATKDGKVKTLRLIYLTARLKPSKFGKPLPARPRLPGMKADMSYRKPLRRGSSEAVSDSSKRAEGISQPQEQQVSNLQDGRETGLPRTSSLKFGKPSYGKEMHMKTVVIDGREVEVEPESEPGAGHDPLAGIDALIAETERRKREHAERMQNPQYRISFYNQLDRKLDRMRSVVIEPKTTLTSGDDY